MCINEVLTKGRNILLVYIISIKNVRGGKVMRNTKRKKQNKDNKGLTLIALIVTTIFSYDENVKSSNNKGFLLQTI